MSKGQCLCGEVQWQLSAEPYEIFNCHCRMCQKAHGAAFGTYAFVKASQLEWTSTTKNIVHYQSSEKLTRSSCSTCGSVVPYSTSEPDIWVVPAGNHDHMRKPDYNIFITDSAPWHTLNTSAPGCDTYPEDSDLKVVAGLPPVEEYNLPDTPLTGSCLCKAITFEISAPLKLARNCHCSRCRRGRSSAHACNGFASFDAVTFLSGEQLLKSYKVPDARFFTQVFCKNCSSLMPRKDPERGIGIVPLGALDTDPNIKTGDHIFVGDKASWYDVTDDLPQFTQGPPA